MARKGKTSKQRPKKQRSNKQQPIKQQPIKQQPIKQRPIKKRPKKRRSNKQQPIEQQTIEEQPNKQQPNKQPPNKPLKKFFSRYPEFEYQPENSPVIEFKRLCKENMWEKDSAEKNAARHKFNLAMIKEFNALYGSDEKDINSWYKLCHVLRIDPVPNTLHGCRAAVSRQHVNLADLVREFREDIHIFESEEELSMYTKKTGKFFPKESAADGGVLRALRRHILVPGQGRISRSK